MRDPGRRRASPAREKLLASAARLFYADGIAATGIDRIISDAGVAKMSLYNNFSSKDDLVLAYIEARHQEWLELWAARTRAARTAAEEVLAVFDAYLDHASAAYDHGFRGCGLLNAAAELPVDAPGREAVRRHKEQVETILADALAKLTDPPTAARTAEHCAFLLEGAMSRAGLEGSPERLERARELAAGLLDAL